LRTPSQLSRLKTDGHIFLFTLNERALPSHLGDGKGEVRVSIRSHAEQASAQEQI